MLLLKGKLTQMPQALTLPHQKWASVDNSEMSGTLVESTPRFIFSSSLMPDQARAIDTNMERFIVGNNEKHSQ